MYDTHDLLRIFFKMRMTNYTPSSKSSPSPVFVFPELRIFKNILSDLRKNQKKNILICENYLISKFQCI